MEELNPLEKFQQEAMAKQQEALAKKKENRMKRLRKRRDRALTGGTFKGGLLHEIYPNPDLLKKQINMYFTLCEADHEPQTIPGLALILGVRTADFLNYSPGPGYPDHFRLVQFAIQRVEGYMAKELSTGIGSTKGKEFLAQNTLGYANKSQVNATQTLEVTERERVRNLTDEELSSQAALLLTKIARSLPPGARLDLPEVLLPSDALN